MFPVKSVKRSLTRSGGAQVELSLFLSRFETLRVVRRRSGSPRSVSATGIVTMKSMKSMKGGAGSSWFLVGGEYQVGGNAWDLWAQETGVYREEREGEPHAKRWGLRSN